MVLTRVGENSPRLRTANVNTVRANRLDMLFSPTIIDLCPPAADSSFR